MTAGAEHYRQAERDLRGLRDLTPDQTIAAAQVEATLALAAVHAVCTGLAWHDVSAATAWRRALGITEPGSVDTADGTDED